MLTHVGVCTDTAIQHNIHGGNNIHGTDNTFSYKYNSRNVVDHVFSFAFLRREGLLLQER